MSRGRLTRGSVYLDESWVSVTRVTSRQVSSPTPPPKCASCRWTGVCLRHWSAFDQWYARGRTIPEQPDSSPETRASLWCTALTADKRSDRESRRYADCISRCSSARATMFDRDGGKMTLSGWSVYKRRASSSLQITGGLR